MLKKYQNKTNGLLEKSHKRKFDNLFKEKPIITSLQQNKNKLSLQI
jgi:hypothetical protein